MLSLHRHRLLPRATATAATTTTAATAVCRCLPHSHSSSVTTTAAAICNPSISLPIIARIHASAVMRASPLLSTKRSVCSPRPCLPSFLTRTASMQQQQQSSATTTTTTAAFFATSSSSSSSSPAARKASKRVGPSSPPLTSPATTPPSPPTVTGPPHTVAATIDPTIRSWRDMLLLPPIPGVDSVARSRMLLLEWFPLLASRAGGVLTAIAVVATTADTITAAVPAISLSSWIFYALIGWQLHKRKIIPIPPAATTATPVSQRVSDRIIHLSSLTALQRQWHNLKFILIGILSTTVLSTATWLLFSDSHCDDVSNVLNDMLNAHSPAHSLNIRLLTPIAEELFYRGILFARLIRVFGVRTAIAVDALLFGIAHLSHGVERAAETVVGAAVLSWVYYRTQTLIVPMIIHILHNCIWVQIQDPVSPLQTDSQLRIALDPALSTTARVKHILQEMQVQLREWLLWTRMKLDTSSSHRAVEHTPAQQSIYAQVFEDATADNTATYSSIDRSKSSSSRSSSGNSSNSSNSNSRTTERLRLRPEWRDSIHTLFGRLDSDGKGYLTPAEFAFIDSLNTQRLAQLSAAEAEVNRAVRDKNKSRVQQLIDSSNDEETSVYAQTFDRLSSSSSAAAATASIVAADTVAASSSSPPSLISESVSLPSALVSALRNTAAQDVAVALFPAANAEVQQWQYDGASEAEKNNAEYAHMRRVLMRRYYHHLETGLTSAFIRSHTAVGRRHERSTAAAPATAAAADGATVNIRAASVSRELFTEYMRRQFILDPQQATKQLLRANSVLDGTLQHPMSHYFVQ